MNKEIILPKEIEFSIEFKPYDDVWLKLLIFLIQSLGVPEEYWR